MARKSRIIFFSLFHRNFSVNARTESAMKHIMRLTPLVYALAQTAYADTTNELFAAASSGALERIESILAQGADANSKTTNGRTALMSACFNGNARIVKALLGYGADVNIADSRGITALMDAVLFGNDEIVRLLITAGADVNAADKANVRVLAKAKKAGHEKIIKLLEASGAKEADPPPAEEKAETEGDKKESKPEKKSK
jgi:ankyrin repeat protein